jgi:UDP-GlcNAc:undecaprenyl-phosphate GlcNAc-1-phosphate transferase
MFPLVVASGAVVFLRAAGPDVQGGWLGEQVLVHVEGAFSRLPQLGLILVGGFFVFLVGLLDDVKGVPVLLKLLVPGLIGAVLAVCGIRASLFVERFHPWGAVICAVVTVLWVMGITNAFNLLDHMDGVCAGCAFIIAAMLGVISFLTGQYFLGCVCLVLAGACAGFLLFNFPPASIFLGDAGSLLIGYLMSVWTVLVTFYRSPHPVMAGQRLPHYAILVPVLMMVVPLFDTAAVVLIRLYQRRPIFLADTNHLCHRLVKMGLAHRQAVAVVYLLTFCCSLSALLVYHTDAVGSLVALAQILVVLAIMVLLQLGTLPVVSGDGGFSTCDVKEGKRGDSDGQAKR